MNNDKPKRIPQIIRPLLAHEIRVWNKIALWLRTDQHWEYDEINYLKYRLSNEMDGFPRFYNSELIKSSTFSKL